ncbi:unnamed protein product [Rotaria sordida]|uniref:Uncharacterized protein n=1 Tax=Rotaria sordida TaxID=392033 RepID=A0A813R382_9BILA|nr:unnamed protein product [Rotaria sordida]CAF0967822.1 unnamed protein product [Rotaria sordida]CAF0968521.1 unnamed protein product [Rotaria sordida]CAF1077001.1 unnamed protein product [Rotaria sordida]
MNSDVKLIIDINPGKTRTNQNRLSLIIMNKQLCHYSALFHLLLLSFYCYASPIPSVDEHQHHEPSVLSTKIHDQTEMIEPIVANTKILCAVYGICNDDDDEYDRSQDIGDDDTKYKRLSASLFHGIPKFGRRAFSSAFAGIPKFG